jgi:hypothetical protein
MSSSSQQYVIVGRLYEIYYHLSICQTVSFQPRDIAGDAFGACDIFLGGLKMIRN